MSIDANPSIKEIATTFGDTPPYSMSELYGLNFSSGNSVMSGTMRLSGFRNKTVESTGYVNESKIVGSDNPVSGGDYKFGFSVSMSSDGSTILVGSNGYNGGVYPGAYNMGSAYIFEKVNGTWTQVARLTASDGASSDNFGWSVSISSDGSTALVGAYGDDSYTGAAYIFEKGSSWSNMTETAKLLALDGEASDYFGWSVSISGDGSTVLVGASEDTEPESLNAGSAYIFEKPGTGWSNMTHTAELKNGEPPWVSDRFGWSVHISTDGSTAIVGERGYNYEQPGGSTYSGQGAAYIFEKPGSGWTTTSTPTAQLMTSYLSNNTYFGWSVHISSDGSTAIVSAPGAAYIFEKGSGWSNMTETAKLSASDSVANFAYSVWLSGDGSIAFVSAYSSSKFYIFRKGGSWSDATETFKLTGSSELGSGNSNAISASSDGSKLLMGSHTDDITSGGSTYVNQGSAYIYEINYFLDYAEAKIVASDGADSDRFGYSVSISNDGSTALVGAYADDSTGSVYIFEKVNGTWTQRAKLTASDGVSNDSFGYFVSISSDGSTALVGAYADDSYTGSAYIFEKPGSGWTTTSTEAAKLTAGNGRFGYSLSISGDGSKALVGAFYDDSREGSAYIFEKVNGTWTEAAKLTASDGVTNDYFGWSVSISSDGSTALVGSYRDDTYTGSAYIYEKPGSGWTTTSTHAVKLTASDGAVGDSFGESVSISSDGSTVLVGAKGDDSSQGSAYIYEKPGSGWATISTHAAKLTASDGAGGDNFGESVSLSSDGSTALVGAKADDTNRGSAYIFEKPGSGWTTTSTEAVKLTASDNRASYDNFGNSVSISGDGSTALVGAFGVDDGTSLNEGAAYIYEFRD